jgi:hypothetical protein
MAINPSPNAGSYASINMGTTTSGKIISLVVPTANAGSGGGASGACAQSMTGGGAVAWDPASQACWGVTGIKIPIGDTDAPVMKGFQIFNFNIHTNGDCCPTTDKYALPGPCPSL